ncbi:TerD family protein [Nocardia rhizosphaerihabitans]|uniref:Tellurium resistance protein TerZ n=1 Tax=Nocardia rhizosphaerihabitans TaxID=1691570 RepID=A0ABQ2L1X3_9NOCA|nr:TerD family protein [Nocardia rhizosphaerihabitans]GGN99292.1 tellurium resistance protein TerZ [Nocardia rhizosphaerihabitans]
MTGALPHHPHGALTHVTMGLGWDPARTAGLFGRRRKDVDLNAAALAFAGERFVDVAFHEQLTSRDGAIRHLGDSVTGDGDGDNEVIVVDLTRLDSGITTIVFIVTCYTGQGFDQIENGFCRVTDNVTGTELVRLELASARSHTGIVLGKLHRPHQDWAFTRIEEPIWAQHIVNVIPQLTNHLR